MTDSIDKKCDDEPPSEKLRTQSPYEIAKQQFPNEYVVFIGSAVFCHTPDRTEAFAQYTEAWKTAPVDQRPYVIPPGAEPQKYPPIMRART